MPIHEFIQQLDQQGMQHISMQEPGAFARYLQETRNTICGRHAAQVWLHGVTYNKDKEVLEIEFVKYTQSSRAKSLQDSSVSYASAVARRR
jgi:AmmeMemoRadiSam system protein B